MCAMMKSLEEEMRPAVPRERSWMTERESLECEIQDRTGFLELIETYRAKDSQDQHFEDNLAFARDLQEELNELKERLAALGANGGMTG